MSAPDISIAWLTVHGGAFHKLITLQDALLRVGVTCELLLCVGAPLGLKTGVDVPESALCGLAARGVHFLSRAEVLARARASGSRLLLTDAHLDPDLPGLIAQARSEGRLTAQMATLLHDFTPHGAEHLLIQHPITLFYEREFHRNRSQANLSRAGGIHFTGNIFYEPTLNDLHGGFADRTAFCAKYGFDRARPICLWLPNRGDVEDASYGQVIEAAARAGVNLAVKLHPWEYAAKKHGGHVWGLAATSDVTWKVRAVDEPDSTWAYAFCDVAVMRTSATCLEMPFWSKPGVMLPPFSKHLAHVAPQVRMVERCSVSLESAQQLAALLSGPLPVFSSEDYASGRAQVRLDTARDAYAQTVACLTGILEGRAPGHPTDPDSVARLYDPLATDLMVAGLPPVRRLRYLAARLWRRISGGAPGIPVSEP